MEVFDGIGVVVNFAVFQEAVELEAGQAEEAGGLVMGEFLGALACNGKRFNRLAAGIGVAGDVVGQLDSDLHRRQCT